VLDTYCWTLMLAAQLGTPISHISEQKGTDLLAIKKKLGLPDSRFDPSRLKECQLSDLETSGSIALAPCSCDGSSGKAGKSGQSASEADLEMLVKSVTDAVMGAINTK
jgi:hypothetical protein